MRFRAEKTIEVRYSAPVFQCVRRLLIAPPKTRGAQTIARFDWQCVPPPDAAREYSDSFGNRVLEVRHQRLERAFQLRAIIEGETLSTQSLPHETALPASGLGAFLLPSALCDATDELRTVASQWKESRAAEKTHSDAGAHSDDETRVEEICALVHRIIEYKEGQSHLRTRASQSLQFKKGVCQDYAHLAIALCRLARVPARYVGGYIEGEGAMHAWLEALCNGRWLAFDPTHNRRAQRCIAVATGRDYRDAPPHSGEYSGKANAEYSAQCAVQFLE